MTHSKEVQASDNTYLEHMGHEYQMALACIEEEEEGSLTFAD